MPDAVYDREGFKTKNSYKKANISIVKKVEKAKLWTLAMENYSISEGK